MTSKRSVIFSPVSVFSTFVARVSEGSKIPGIFERRVSRGFVLSREKTVTRQGGGEEGTLFEEDISLIDVNAQTVL